ncbi:MAG: glycerol-3-phosphate acyltransferase [Dehalococcoidia bacterium]|jgi:glycerol-3-phosphate acyltransferase PlsY|nr:glycerol-3-phosphate acyltransferase [Dehalococcoidia bacterium]
MDTTGHVLTMLVIGYLLGSIPFARLFTMRSGVDLFSTGTGNPGAANVFRRVDKRTGIAVFAGDSLKGAIPVAIAWAIGAPQDLWIVAGAAAVVGHLYPVFNRFRGGAGLATGAGVVVALIPLASLVGVPFGGLVLWKFKSSGHSAAAGLVVILALAFPFGSELPAVAGSSVLAAILFAKAAARGWRPGRRV